MEAPISLVWVGRGNLMRWTVSNHPRTGGVMIMARRIAIWVAILVVASLSMAGCGAESNPDGDAPLSYRYEFDTDTEGWTGDFTDLPVDYEEDIYELRFEHADLPGELESDGKALMLSSINRSDDIFMYVKRQLTKADGIKPGTTYRITFEVEFATDAPAGAVGVGGPPGEAVWVKVGAAPEDPVPVEVMDGGVPFYVLSVDKGRQNEDGENAIRIGDVAKVDNDEFDVYEFKTLDNSADPLEITSCNEGSLWIFVGTDSGFEGKTTLYYNMIQVQLEEVK